jgi:hypothetical protein
MMMHVALNNFIYGLLLLLIYCQYIHLLKDDKNDEIVN